MTSIDAKEAASALSDIDSVARRVRQSTIYQLSSLFIITWGVLVVAGNLTSFVWPRSAGFSWLAVYLAGIAGSFDQRNRLFPNWHPHLRFPYPDRVFSFHRVRNIHLLARPFNERAPDRDVLGDVFHAGLHHCRAVDRARLRRNRSVDYRADLDRLLLPGPLVRAVDGAGERRRTDSGWAMDAPELTNG
jgi:hypothetical protein